MENVYISVAELSSWMQEKYFKDKDMISIEDLLWEFENLDSEYDHMKEEFEDFKSDVEDNYKFVGMEEQVE